MHNYQFFYFLLYFLTSINVSQMLKSYTVVSNNKMHSFAHVEYPLQLCIIHTRLHFLNSKKRKHKKQTQNCQVSPIGQRNLPVFCSFLLVSSSGHIIFPFWQVFRHLYQNSLFEIFVIHLLFCILRLLIGNSF